MSLSRIKTRIYNTWCVLIHWTRRGYFYLRKREPTLLDLNISDPILVNERAVRVEYCGENICSVHIPGIIRSLRMKDQLTFKLPLGTNEITIIFSGARNNIERHQRFTFLRVAVNDAAFNWQVHTKRDVQFISVLSVSSLRYPNINRRHLTIQKSQERIIKSNSPKNISTEEFKSEILHT